MLTRSQDLRRAADADVTPLEREGASPPFSSGRVDGLGGAEAGNHDPNGPVGDGVEPGAPPMPPPPQQPRAGTSAAHSPHLRGAGEHSTPSASRRSASGLPGVHNRNDALAMLRSLLDFPLAPESPQFAAWHARVNALLDYSRVRSDAPRGRSQSGLSPAPRAATATAAADAAAQPVRAPAPGAAAQPSRAPHASVGSSSSSPEPRDARETLNE